MEIITSMATDWRERLVSTVLAAAAAAAAVRRDVYGHSLETTTVPVQAVAVAEKEDKADMVPPEEQVEVDLLAFMCLETSEEQK